MLKKLSFFVFTSIFLLYKIECSNILGIFWTPSRSHHILGSALLQSLAKKGHNVTLLTPFIDDVNITTFRQNKLGGLEDALDGFALPNTTVIQQFFLFFEKIEENVRNLWQDKEIQYIIKTKEKFDLLMVISFFNDGLFALKYHLGVPLILFSPTGSSNVINKYCANPNLPYTTSLQFSQGTPDTFLGRLAIASSNMLLRQIEIMFVRPVQEREKTKQFPNAPSISELEKSVDLLLVNSHYSIESPRPYVPNMIQIGGFYAQNVNKLPQDIQDYLDEATDGAILFSFGTNMKISSMEDDKLRAILEGLRNIAPVKVLFKSEIDIKAPSNVLVRKWLPQNDILAHPNIKVFISHGGLGSTTETLYHGVPMLGIPLFFDQKTNIQNALNAGYAVRLLYDDITKESFQESLLELLHNTKYAENAKKRSILLRNQPIQPLAHAIWWVEHIIENKGGKHLTNKGMDLEWYQLYMIDIALFYATLIVVIIILCIYFIRCSMRCLVFKKRKQKIT